MTCSKIPFRPAAALALALASFGLAACTEAANNTRIAAHAACVSEPVTGVCVDADGLLPNGVLYTSSDS